MAGITFIRRDQNDQSNIVRIVAENTLAEVGTAGYLLAQADNIAAFNHASDQEPFDWQDSDLALIYCSDGHGFFEISADREDFVILTGLVSTALTDAHIFVGDASNIATDVAVSGDLTLANTGAFTIANNAVTTAKILNANVTLAKLAAGITPSHVIKFAGQPTTVGGAAAEAFTVTGALATDLAFVQMVDNGTNNVTVLQAVMTSNTLTVTFSADPGNDAVINYQIIRAAA